MIKRLLINLLPLAFLLSCTSTTEAYVQPKSSAEAIYQSPDDGDQSPSTPVPSSDAIIVDHTLVPLFSSIPAADLQAAASIKTLFMHQSTGNNIVVLGLRCLAGINDPNSYPECAPYSANPPYDPYDSRNWEWTMWNTPMADAIAKTDEWVSVVNAQQGAYQVLGMKFCYVDGWNQDFDYYRQAMEQLERTYPQKKFIWTT